MQKKINTDILELCEGLPNEFYTFFSYCKNLRFEEKPDYSFLRRIFREVFIKENFSFDYAFDWCLPRGNSTAKPKKQKKTKENKILG